MAKENEEKKLEKLEKFEFTCTKCNAVTTISAYQRNSMLNNCNNCGQIYCYDELNDPIGYIHKAIDSLKKVKGVKLRLICGDNDE
jgi:transcription elongation factor Elf1